MTCIAPKHGWGTKFSSKRSGRMDQIFADMFPATQIPYPVIFARFCGAIFFGGLIGFEREAQDKAAGLRTHILISLAAAVFAIISIESVHMPGLSDAQVQIDPLRVVEAVTAGVAFLAAGTLVLSGGQVRGLTTGAGMWLAGAIGLALGFGHWLIAAFALAAGLTVLYAVAKVQDAIRAKTQLLPPRPVFGQEKNTQPKSAIEKKRTDGISADRPVR